jgi:putative addiction module component (TIGR02574 family)
MSETAQAILAAALSLSEAERGELVDRLVESLSPPDPCADMTDEEFIAEVDRRREEALNGTDPGIPWSEVERKLLEDLNAGPER